MICPYCGKENPETNEICEFCGGPLLETTKGAVAETRPTEPAVEIVQTRAEIPEPEIPAAQATAPPSGGIFGNRKWWIFGCLAFACLILGCVAAGAGMYRVIKSLGFLNPVTGTPFLLVPQATTNTPRFGVATNTLAITPVSATQQTEAPTPSPMLSTPKLLFSDDFSNPNSGWDEVEESDYSTEYFEGAYRILVNTDMSDSWANPADQNFGNVLIEVDATKHGGPDDNDFGLICRYLDKDRYYYAVISSDGYYGIIKVTSDTSEILGRDNLNYSELINQGNVPNHIRFDCVGEKLTLYVNGHLLDLQTDKEYASGNVGLVAGTYKTPGTDILFDNFKVYSP